MADAKLLLFLLRLLQIVEVLLEHVALNAEHVFVAEVTPVEVGQIAGIECTIGFVEA